MASRVVELLEVAGIEEGRAPIAGDCTACDACKPVCPADCIVPNPDFQEPNWQPSSAHRR